MTNEITKYMLTMCYHCTDAADCQTEEECNACFVERAALQEDQTQEITTEQLLREYAL